MVGNAIEIHSIFIELHDGTILLFLANISKLAWNHVKFYLIWTYLKLAPQCLWWLSPWSDMKIYLALLCSQFFFNFFLILFIYRGNAH